MLRDNGQYKVANVKEWAQKKRDAALSANEALMVKISQNPVHEMAWKGYCLASNEYIVQKMERLLALLDSDVVTDENVFSLCQVIQGEIISEQINFTGEGSQNPGHAYIEHGKAVGRKSILGDWTGYLLYMTPEFQK